LTALLNVPAAHGEQSLVFVKAPRNENVPSGQGKQALAAMLCSWALKVATGHSLQIVCAVSSL
jgi:hypothetical protein